MLSQLLPDITGFSASGRHFPVNDYRPVGTLARTQAPVRAGRRRHMLYI
jgi:hypothetical protein